MTPTEPPSLIDETSSLSAARIDAQEEEFVSPLREYLETNGCQVFVNQTTDRPAAYHIVTGDVQFVKSIFSAHKNSTRANLGIVLGSTPADAQKELHDLCKIVVVDPIHITPSDVVEIFTFFFAGNSIVFDKRRNRHEPLPVEKPAVLQSADQERIGTIISDVFQKRSDQQQTAQETKAARHRRRKMKISIWASIAFFLFICIFPGIWYGVSVGISVASFALSAKELKQSNVTGAEHITAVGNYWLHQAQFSFGLVALPFHLVGYDSDVRGQERLLSLLSDISSAFTDTFVIVKSGKDVATLLLTSSAGGTSGSPAFAIDRLRISVVSVSGTLGLAKAQLATLLRDHTFPFIIPAVTSVGERSLVTLETLRGVFAYVDELLTLYPNLAGFKEPKTYLVLLQNSNELRPTGGFIGSVGIVKFQDGTMSDFTIQDVYALDGQLKGHVDPPGPLRDLLGEEHWYLRDSNWDPDFKQSATRAAWFYEKESGTTVDGVVALNVPVIVDLLSATGPIRLADYNDQISADNFFGKSFYYTQNDFFPGSTQKSDFLGTLARALITKLTSEKTINPIAVFRATAAGLMRKDILFMFDDTNLQQLVEHFGWGGRVLDQQGCDGVEREFCSYDPLISVEANMSVSKVNYFVKRLAVREITITPDGAMTESYSLTIRNTSNVVPSDATQGIGGAYIPYIRFLVPQGTLVNDVTLDGAPIHARDTKQKGVPTLPYIETISTDPAIRGIGVALEIPPGTKRTIRITFSRLNPLPFGRGGTVVDFMYYKHPGVSDETVQTILRYPVYWSVTDESKGVHEGQTFLAKEGQLEYNSTILQDQVIRLRFIK